MIYIDGEKCAGCGVCEDVCPVEAIRVSDGVARIDQNRCTDELCEACVEACPNKAILVVIEPTEEKAISFHEQPAPEVAPAGPPRSPTLLRAKVIPVVGTALAFLGREVAPRLATYLIDALERQSQQPTLRTFDKLRTTQAQDATVSPNNDLASPGSGKGRRGGRRHRHRRRGK
jgi:ferredoxin